MRQSEAGFQVSSAFSGSLVPLSYLKIAVVYMCAHQQIGARCSWDACLIYVAGNSHVQLNKRLTY